MKKSMVTLKFDTSDRGNPTLVDLKGKPSECYHIVTTLLKDGVKYGKNGLVTRATLLPVSRMDNCPDCQSISSLCQVAYATAHETDATIECLACGWEDSLESWQEEQAGKNI